MISPLCVWIGYILPVVKLTKIQWDIVHLIYITLASILPVWILLQPRDYLCSFLLYAMLAAAVIEIFLTHPTMQLSGFISFTVNNQTLFLFLFVTVAYGAVLGFHSLVASGTTSKQITKEGDAKLKGYGAMLMEGLVAIVALIAVRYVAKSLGTPAQVFAAGVATFINSFGLPMQIGKIFTILVFFAFALTSLETATRIG